MLNAIARTLRTLVFERGLVDPLEVDVSFETPDDEWIGSLTRPAVNFFLYDVCENTDKRDGAPQTMKSGTRAEMRMPPRRIDLSYMVSAQAGDIGDEHELLWRVLETLMRHQQLPRDILDDSLRGVAPPIVARVAARDEGRNLLELWTALGTEPHPAVCYVLTAPMDVALAIEAPLVLTRTARYRRLPIAAAIAGGQEPDRTRVQIGGFVRNGAGEPLADISVVPDGSAVGAITAATGAYVLGVPPGDVRLRLSSGGTALKTVSLRVPGPPTSYDIVLDG